MSETTVTQSDVTLDDVIARLDSLGHQMDWLVQNLASLFSFVNVMSQNGGGIRGLMKTLKQQEGLPVITEAQGE